MDDATGKRSVGASGIDVLAVKMARKPRVVASASAGCDGLCVGKVRGGGGGASAVTLARGVGGENGEESMDDATGKRSVGASGIDVLAVRPRVGASAVGGEAARRGVGVGGLR